MATQEYYVGSVGPLLYDDTETYSDAVGRVAFRGAQIYLDGAPTEDEHALRKVDMPSFSSASAEQGDIWYYDGSEWALLHHGTAGERLQTGGHAANPSWAGNALNDLSDVVISSPVAGDTIYYNGTNWIHRTQDGWIVDADTWTYVSATSFKISGKDVVARFPVGTKLKLTQTTAKYFYVVSAAFSTDTTVTITGGSDYSLANAAITNPHYSYQICPQGFPMWHNFTETWTGFSSAPSGGTCRFKMCGDIVYFLVVRGSGTSNSASMTVSLPIAGANLYQNVWGVAMDNGTWQQYACRAQVAPGATTATLSKQLTGAWTASGSKVWEGMIIYEV